MHLDLFTLWLANFHLTNGATLYRLNWMADQSDKGLQQSLGFMVNYRYFLDSVDANSSAYTLHASIDTSVEIQHQQNALSPNLWWIKYSIDSWKRSLTLPTLLRLLPNSWIYISNHHVRYVGILWAINVPRLILLIKKTIFPFMSKKSQAGWVHPVKFVRLNKLSTTHSQPTRTFNLTDIFMNVLMHEWSLNAIMNQWWSSEQRD